LTEDAAGDAGAAVVAAPDGYTRRRAMLKAAVWLLVAVGGTAGFAFFANAAALSAWLGLVGSVTLALPAVRLLNGLRTDAKEVKQASEFPSRQGPQLAQLVDTLSKARPATYSVLDALTYAAGLVCVAASFVVQMVVSFCPVG
jgi:hypothetical protein